MRNSSKRWLMSMLKTSGSQRRYVQNGNAADERHVKGKTCFDNLPKHESVKSTLKFYNGKINTGPLVKFLRNNIGADWDEVYSEVIARIPSKLLDYKEMIFWFVADKVDVVDGKLWNRKTQKFIWTDGPYILRHHTEMNLNPEFREFYVDSDTNILKHIPQKSFKKISVRQ
ncbi:hypothetical protein HER32_02125 [Hymenobacter sp. BT18]|uniref:hypothetical protein n=1 Tax=Hymenobacter sp. BT18 TaxID=2835648 RepID=UPI00143EDF3E|nr:hypothetical protein [Hymenobacter sp. BT18]QIX60049.1 hypothetical protein HER32_02125 [Hymenobacter sp. BT18]